MTVKLSMSQILLIVELAVPLSKRVHMLSQAMRKYVSSAAKRVL